MALNAAAGRSILLPNSIMNKHIDNSASHLSGCVALINFDSDFYAIKLLSSHFRPMHFGGKNVSNFHESKSQKVFTEPSHR